MALSVDLVGKTVLVTGASRGIGRALAEGLAEAGATVGVHYGQHREAAEELAGCLGRGARAFQADLSQTSGPERLFEQTVAAFGHVDVLVNNAGVALPAPLDAPSDVWQRAWETTMAVNLRAVEGLCRLAIRHFQTRGGGRLINVASRAAFRGDTPEYLAYAASKAGVVALTRSIARGFGKDHITAFVLAPGFVRTDMAQDFIDRYGEGVVLDDLALDRLTKPADLAPLTVLLASGLMDHATGCTIDVNAGSYVH